MDTLRIPRKRDQKPWEWRRDSPIRPVVFDDPGIIDDGVVHLHLEHRIVQRLLGRFISQGFVFDDLSRACMTQTKDDIPRVILLGRLALYGPGAARLHEQLVPVTAKWIDPDIRKSPLEPYKIDAETKTMSLLNDAFNTGPKTEINETVKKQLQEAATTDIGQLLDHLQQRGEEYAELAIKKLNERAEAESKAMLGILRRQREHIKKTQKAAENRDWDQMRIKFVGDELDNETETATAQFKQALLGRTTGNIQNMKSKTNQIGFVKCTR